MIDEKIEQTIAELTNSVGKYNSFSNKIASSNFMQNIKLPLNLIYVCISIFEILYCLALVIISFRSAALYVICKNNLSGMARAHNNIVVDLPEPAHASTMTLLPDLM